MNYHHCFEFHTIRLIVQEFILQRMNTRTYRIFDSKSIVTCIGEQLQNRMVRGFILGSRFYKCRAKSKEMNLRCVMILMMVVMGLIRWVQLTGDLSFFIIERDSLLDLIPSSVFTDVILLIALIYRIKNPRSVPHIHDVSHFWSSISSLRRKGFGRIVRWSWRRKSEVW